MAKNDKRPAAYDEGVIPFDPSKHESWDGGRAFPVGKYLFEITKYGPGKDGKSMAVHLKAHKGPGDTEDMKGQVFLDFFHLEGNAGNFLKGWLEKVCPACMEPVNMVKTAKGVGINASYLTGGKSGTGTMIECDLYEDHYTDKKTGKPETSVKADRRTVVLVSPSSFTAAQTGAVAAGGDGASAGADNPWAAPAE